VAEKSDKMSVTADWHAVCKRRGGSERKAKKANAEMCASSAALAGAEVLKKLQRKQTTRTKENKLKNLKV
jgi:RNA polymerase-interacting CarD/CdnL/TRCF family regulator